MAEKKRAVMHIGGKQYKISGAESDEQVRMIEKCVNDKLKELRKLFSVQGLEEEQIAMLAAINLADDYIRMQRQVQLLKSKNDKLAKHEKELREAVEQYEEELLNLEAENQDYAEKLKKAEE